jgi:hypothetical protein
MRTVLTLKQRLVSLFFYLAALAILSALITNTWFPTEGGKSLWFFGAIGLIFFTRLSSPFFVAPRDSLANCAAAALLLATIDLSSVSFFQDEIDLFRWIAVGYAIFVCFTSIIAISLFKTDQLQRPRVALASDISFQLSENLGKGQIVFTPIVLISILGFYQQKPIEQVWLLFVWTILVFVEPVDLVLRIISLISNLNPEKSQSEAVGEIQRIDDPKILRVRLSDRKSWDLSKVHIAQLPDSTQIEVLPLFIQTQNAELIGTGLCHSDPPTAIANAKSGYVYSSNNVRNSKDILCELCGDEQPANLIGFVIENSVISKIRFEAAPDQNLQRGWIVFVKNLDERIYYQILDAKTDEESFSQNPKGIHAVSAQQLGILESHKGFLKYGWLPKMNSPVFLASEGSTDFASDAPGTDDFLLGSVPHSQIPVLASFKDLLEYHTAILGATGKGKTELAFDLIRKATKHEIKVVCVDFTGEYNPRLNDLKPKKLGLDEEQAIKLQEKLFDVEAGEYSASKEKRALEEFIQEIKPGIEAQVQAFLEKDPEGLGIFELEEIANTKATLRATELYLSLIFNWARKNRKKRHILLVLEEAHTIVPEMNYFGHDRVETGAVVGRLGQIALQGRKYGVGILLISQRTALVSKTLLSQCNTVISFAMHDETGLKYLTNVFNSEQVSEIPNLKFLQAMAFGKAIRSEYPIIFEIPEDDEKKKASEALADKA